MTDLEFNNDDEDGPDLKYSFPNFSYWSEPEVGVDLPEKPPEVDHKLDPGKAEQESRRQIEEMIGDQFFSSGGFDPSHNKASTQQSRSGSADKPSNPAGSDSVQIGEDQSSGHVPDDEDFEERMSIIDEEAGPQQEDSRESRPEESAEEENLDGEETDDDDRVEQIIDARDNLLRAKKHSSSEVAAGLDQTLKELDSMLEDYGVEEISPEPGDEFDPYRHKAVKETDDGQAEGTIVEVVRPGYEDADYILYEAEVVVQA